MCLDLNVDNEQSNRIEFANGTCFNKSVPYVHFPFAFPPLHINTKNTKNGYLTTSSFLGGGAYFTNILQIYLGKNV